MSFMLDRPVAKRFARLVARSPGVPHLTFPLPGSGEIASLPSFSPQRSIARLRVAWRGASRPSGVLMISIVLYGRNDNYGYNLHKRAALSLNCMAEVLTDPSDEILFVDYNTPDDFPTFPEAIQDTLTKRAREILRILRVRPRIHERFKSKTHLLALEPIARNVAVRRSSPSNRWILSTNTDMIFVPQGGRSLSEIARELGARLLSCAENRNSGSAMGELRQTRSHEHHQDSSRMGEHITSQRDCSWVEIHPL